MSKRSDRRETERLARKLAYQQSRESAPAASPLPQAAELAPISSNSHLLAPAQAFFQQSAKPSAPASEARLAANRANALQSTGPLTSAGKAVSSRNSLKHGLTGNTVLLDSDDAAAYQSRLDYYTGFYQPVGFEERRLVQAIHDANWRLDRITHLEFATYAKGRLDLSGLFDDIPEFQRKSFLELEISQRFQKEIRNLHTQESRIQRQRAKDLAALQQLQSERRQAEQEAAEQVTANPAARQSTRPAKQQNGFVFSTAATVAENASPVLAGTNIHSDGQLFTLAANADLSPNTQTV